MSNDVLFILGFVVFIFVMMAIDLGLFARPDRPVSLLRAGLMSAVWIGLALGFYALLFSHGELLHHINSYSSLQEINARYLHNLPLSADHFKDGIELYRKNLSVEFITGYLVEYALSVDNIFVMVLIFTAFSVEPRYYHKVLVWGIIGAVIMRFAFIFIGASLIAHFHAVLYFFGAFLVYTGV